MTLHTYLRATVVASALALIGASALAQVVVKEEIGNGGFRGSVANSDPLRGWANGGVNLANPSGAGALPSYQAQFDDGADFLRQGLGTFSAGVALEFSFMLMDATYTSVANPLTNPTGELNRKGANILRYGFQTQTGNTWSWVLEASDYVTGFNATPAPIGLSYATTGTETLRIAFDAFSSAGNLRTSTIDNVSVLSYSPITAVPEPETYAMLLAGLGAIGFMSRRRQGKTVASAA